MFWKTGRQAGGDKTPYKVRHLMPMWLCSLLKFDMALVKYDVGSALTLHVDNDLWWKGYDTVRTNIVLRKAEEGGHFQLSGVSTNPDKLWKLGKFLGFSTVTFRPDIMPHRVTKVRKGSRLVLSIGRFKKTERADISCGSENSQLRSSQHIRTTEILVDYYLKSYMDHKVKVNGLVWPCTGDWGQFTQDTNTLELLIDMRQKAQEQSRKDAKYFVETMLGKW